MQHPAALLAAGLSLHCAAAANAAPAAALAVLDAWIRAVPGTDVAAAYLTLRNNGREPLVIVGVRSPIAPHAMIHETQTLNGQSTMRPRETLRIAPGETVTFAPGGLHVMLEPLAHPLTVGEEVPLVILLEGGASVEAKARVRALTAE
ncbi:MAG TPA: copper chaperone PCu(A)C [Steroidobacteraceae bacterium]|nr:copper chaperone PCu(A)C [Steroidobacteraceae bacterium]